ncbi:ATP-binding cassette domain-containing protein [Nonomuraea muscovyensis]|uniref:ATP-binding cassette domain-containing protein n=1 Tax=Nonomuraea muscovyensis TaxID=1124761 RepID=UPI001FE3821E|nr:ATP-binding cassette domain-containing protein [Nonomuraea muscovyensis]
MFVRQRCGHDVAPSLAALRGLSRHPRSADPVRAVLHDGTGAARFGRARTGAPTAGAPWAGPLWAGAGSGCALNGGAGAGPGAGRSTLVRCVSGIHRPDRGQIFFDGEERAFHSPEKAREAGIETVHQNLALVEDLTVWQNLFLNRELVRRPGPVALLDRRAMRDRAREMVSTLTVNVPAVGSRVRPGARARHPRSRRTIASGRCTRSATG